MLYESFIASENHLGWLAGKHVFFFFAEEGEELVPSYIPLHCFT